MGPIFPGSTTVTGETGTVSTSNYTTQAHDYASDVSVKSKLGGYWKLKAEGKPLPVLPYSRTVTKGVTALPLSGTLKQVRIKTGKVVNSYSFNYTVVSTTHDPVDFCTHYASQILQAQNDAKGYLANHIANVMVDLPTELVEADKTAKMITKYLDASLTLFKEFRVRSSYLRRQLKKALTNPSSNKQTLAKIKKLANALNGLYLEYNYGWKPLVYTLDGTIKILEDQFRAHKVRKKMSGHATFYNEARSYSIDVLIPNCQGLTVKVDAMTSIKYDCWVGGLLKEEDVGPSSLVQELGLEASNIPMSLWELTYMSFIFDYFTSIGGVLGNLRGLIGKLQPVSLYMSEKTVVTEYLMYKNQGIIPYDGTTYQYKKSIHGANISQVRSTTFFTRKAMSASDLNVSLIFRQPTGLQVFKTLSVAIQTLGLLKKR